MLFKKVISAITILSLVSTTAFANPVGGQVISGSASIRAEGDNLTVNQRSNKALIDWRGFNIAPQETTEFKQPTSDSITVNRISDIDPSRIEGSLKANGNLVLINPNGIVFGKDSKVDVNGIVASTSGINEEEFRRGNLSFDQPGKADAKITNDGTITAKDSGLVGLVAPQVVNNGIIRAKLGKVNLSSGDTFTLDLAGDGLIQLAVTGDVKDQLVSNSGLIEAQGGEVYLTAAAARNAVNSLVSNSGTIAATSTGEKTGKVRIFAEGSNAIEKNDAASKSKKPGESYALNSGVIDVSGYMPGEKGGKARILADNVGVLNGSVIDASGDAGGGDIRIGGDYLGTGVTPTAKNTFVDTFTLIYNDAKKIGDGGRTIVWADGNTHFSGNIYGRGGIESGNGGFVETSGKQYLDARGFVDLTAPNGEKGTYLLDPADITIYGNVDPAFVSTDGTINLASGLKLWLDASDTSRVQLTYSTDGLSGATATGTNGTNSITTSADVSANLVAGARIRLGSAGTVTTADTVGADTYTITSIAGTTITLASNLTQNYTASNLHRGLVSQLADKSGQGNTASKGTAANMPLWVSNGQNGLGSIRFDGANDQLDGVNLGLNAVSEVTTLVVGQATGNGTLLALDSSLNGNMRGDYFLLNGIGHGVGFWNITNPSIIGTLRESTNSKAWVNGIQTGATNTVALGNVAASPYVLGNRFAGVGDSPVNGRISEATIYSTELADAARNIVEQYQSAKWGLALTPPGTGATEVAKATAPDGYSVFTTRYLERLSQSADISLLASNSITLDLKGDTLALGNDRNLSLTTTNGNISSASAGTITTSRNTTGGNISITAGGAGNITLSNVGLNAISGGLVNLAAGGTVNVTSPTALNLGTVSGTGITLRATGATSDLTIASSGGVTASDASGDSIVLVSGRNFLNLAGSSALSTAGTARYLVYSTNHSDDALGALANDFRRFSCTYGGACPSYPGSGNGFLYSFTPTLTATPNAVAPITSGDAAPNLNGYSYNITGYLDSDAADDSVTGTLNGTTPYTPGSSAGTYAINYDTGVLASALGYSLTYANSPSGLTVNASPSSGGGSPVTPSQPVIPVTPDPIPQPPGVRPGAVIPPTVSQAVSHATRVAPPAPTLIVQVSNEGITLAPNETAGQDAVGDRSEGVQSPCRGTNDETGNDSCAPAVSR